MTDSVWHYYENWQLKTRGYYLNGKKEGLWLVSKYGNLKLEYYQAGRLQVEPSNVFTPRSLFLWSTILRRFIK